MTKFVSIGDLSKTFNFSTPYGFLSIPLLSWFINCRGCHLALSPSFLNLSLYTTKIFSNAMTRGTSYVSPHSMFSNNETCLLFVDALRFPSLHNTRHSNNTIWKMLKVHCVHEVTLLNITFWLNSSTFSIKTM